MAAVAGILFGSLTACSPYVYNQEITRFGTGVMALAASYQTGRQAVDASVFQQQQAGYLASRTRLHLLDGCLAMDPGGTPPVLPACMVVPPDVTVAPAPSPRQQALIDAAPSFAALQTYADALSAVTNAADSATLTQATQSLTAAVGSLAGAIATVAPATAPAAPVATQASTVFGLLITSYLDSRRYAALRDSVPTADGAIKTLSKTVQAALVAIRAAQLEQLEDDLSTSSAPFLKPAIGKLAPAEYQAQLAGLQAKVTAFNQARSADPVATVAAMVTAHQQLADALKNGKGQVLAVLAAAQGFATAAGQLKAAVDAASAGATPKSATRAAAAG